MKSYSARVAILNALMEGRHLSQLNCKEFMIEDMRTYISHMNTRKEFPEYLELKKKWIVSPVKNVRLREYWLERKEETCQAS